MSERLERETAIRKMHEVNSFMQNPLFIQAVETYEADLYERWRTTTPDDIATREQVWFQQYALDQVKIRLTRPVDEGTLAVEAQDRDNFQARLG